MGIDLTSIDNLYLMIFVFVVFLITIYLLNIWLYKPLLDFMHSREESINSDEKSVHDAEHDSHDIRLQIKETISAAKQKAAIKIEEATNAARDEYDAKLKEARANVEMEKQAFDQTLNEEKEALKEELFGQIESFKNTFKIKIVGGSSK